MRGRSMLDVIIIRFIPSHFVPPHLFIHCLMEQKGKAAFLTS